MDLDTATEMSSSTVDQCRLQRANAPAMSLSPPDPPRARGRSNSISTEFPSTFEQPITRAGIESAFALLEYTDGRPPYGETLKDLHVLAKAMSSTKLDHDLFQRNPHPEKMFALQITFMRNGQIVTNRWGDGRYLFYIVEALKEGKLNWVFDTSGVKLAPRRLRMIRVLKRPRETAYYATWMEVKGEGDVACFVVWVDGVAVRTKRFWRTKRGQ